MVFNSQYCMLHPILKNIPLFTNKDLLLELKKLVTLEPTKNMPMARGVPSFVRTNDLVQKTSDGIEKIINMLNEMIPNLANTVESTIERRSVENGFMTIKVLEDRLFSLKHDVVHEMTEIVQAIQPNAVSLQGVDTDHHHHNNENGDGEDITNQLGMTGRVK